MRRILAILTMLLAGAAGIVQGADWVGYQQQGHINDYGNVLSAENRAGLEEMLGELQTQYGVNLNLITVPTSGNVPIQDLTESLYNLWELGRQTNNQSALMLLSVGDGKMHLYVGMGLRGVLSTQWTDVMAEKIGPMVESRRFNKACVVVMTAMTKRVYNKVENLPRGTVRLVNKVGALEKVAKNAKALPIAAVIALAFGGFLVISTVMRAGKQTSLYEMGRDFERGRTGPFGNKNPRWL